MRRLRFWGLLPALCLLALPLVAAEKALKLGEGSARGGEVASVALTMDSDAEVQGLVAAFDWEGAKAEGVSLEPGAALADADTVVRRVEPSYMVLGVVMDSDGLDGEVIEPGADIDLATASIRCLGTDVETDVVFRDNLYATVSGGPVLENIVVVGGLSIGTVEGLGLVSGKVQCLGLIDRFYIDSATANSTTGRARVLMENRGAVEGYVVALQNAAGITLTGIDVGAAAAASDFSDADLFADGGTIGVVMDLVAPYTNETIPAGTGNEIAVYKYTCDVIPQTADVSYALTFVDNVFGDPLKENVMVVGGLSINPLLEDGTFTCKRVIPSNEICGNGIDDDLDGFTDCDDSECASRPECIPAEQSFLCGERTAGGAFPSPTITQSRGGTAEVCFYILNPEDEAPGIPQYDHIQGFSMAITYCCDIEVVAESLDITGTILEAIGAEYVNVQADNNPDDGDGCQMIIGVLVDALPPFDGTTIPPTDRVQLMGCVTFRVKDEAPCDACCPIEFTDGVNGRGKVPINNLIAVENNSKRPAAVYACELCAKERERFFRGDCNFSGDSGADGSLAVDIADAAAVVSFLFAPGPYKFYPPCLDACDCNDDGRIDLADAVCILRYLFQFGKFPPAPGPGWRETGLPNPQNVESTGAGEDPTFDLLDCAAGNGC